MDGEIITQVVGITTLSVSAEIQATGFSTNTNMGTNANFGANQSFATTPNSIATSTAQNQTPTPWSYDEPSTTPTPWSTTTATPTPWSNGATYPQQSPTIQNVSNYNNIDAQKQAQILQAQRNAVNQILMNGMDALYGMNRTLNGMTFGGLDYLGNKLGYDTQMNNYLQLKNPQERELAQNVGQLAQLGGGALVGGTLAKTGLNQANIAYNGYKIGKKYDQLVDDPFIGNGSDVIARMKNHNGEPVVLQRGEAILGPDGRVIASGNELKRAVGTKSNYGLDKGIYKHEVSRADAQRIPRIIQQKPVETNNYGQNVYLVRSKNGDFRVVTSPKDDENIISTMYYLTK